MAATKPIGPAASAGRGAVVDVDAIIRRFAALQNGLVTVAQMLAAGITPHQIEYRVRRGRLVRVYRGVYRVGPLAMPLEPEAGALLLYDGSGLLSHDTAAWRSRLAADPTDRIIHVSVERARRQRVGHVRFHIVARVPADERMILEGLPMTGPARTLLDVAGTWPLKALERAIGRADREHGVTAEQIERILDRYPRRAGVGALRRLLETGSTIFLRSQAEAHFLDLIDSAELPRPKTNVRIHGIEVDFYWPRERLVVEIDGAAYHSSAKAFETDRRRDALLVAHGLRVVRFTYRQLTKQPYAVTARVAGALAAHPPS